MTTSYFPIFPGAPLTALIKPGGGVRPITVGETLRRLVSKVCYLAVCSALPDVFLPFGQVGVGVSVEGCHTFITYYSINSWFQTRSLLLEGGYV